MIIITINIDFSSRSFNFFLEELESILMKIGATIQSAKGLLNSSLVLLMLLDADYHEYGEY